MKRKGLHILGIVLSIFMLAGVFTSDVSAYENQIGDHYAADKTNGSLSTEPEIGGDTSLGYADDWVRTNKTISPGEKENEFLITLDVRTKEAIENVELTEDAAVVLVIDLSNSMNEGNRLAKAKEAALKFISNFKEPGSGNAKRKVAVVGFNGQQEISWSHQEGIVAAKTYSQWTDATDNSVKEKIEGMKAEGGSCLQAGLVLARNLLKSGDVRDIANKNIVILTDGKPTYYLSEQETEKESTDYIGDPDSIRGTGNSTSHDTHTRTEKTSKELIQSGINVYGIYMGNERVVCDDFCGVNKTGAGWLQRDCGFIAYAAEDVDKLSEVFERISELIKLQARAWLATDPVGEMFEFDRFENNQEDKNRCSYSASDKKIHWNLRMSEPVSQTEDGFTVYQLVYRVRLNTLASGYRAGKFYPVNGITSVTYLINKQEEIDYGTAYFNVPSAKGYDADISFTKVDGKGNPLAGAVFGLYYGERKLMTAVSGENGEVLFKNVPSGHSYTIVEESAPEGYVPDNEKYRVRVSYGDLSGTIGEGDTVINEEEQKYGDLVVSKSVSGEGADTEREFGFTVSLSDEGITGKLGDLDFTGGVASFTLKDGESKTATGIPAGVTYVVTENGEEGYTPGIRVNGEEKTDATGVIAGNGADSVHFDNFYMGKTDPEDKGGFIVSKTVTGDGADLDDEFDFTVVLNDESINGTCGQMEFEKGVADFKLKNGEEITASGLPEGTGYTVTEMDSKGYEVSINGERGSSIDGTVEKDVLKSIEFNNFKAGEPAPLTGGIDIFKRVIATGSKVPDWESTFGFVILNVEPEKADGEEDVVAMIPISVTGTGTEGASYTFDRLDFTESGVLSYYIHEMPGYEDSWKYDDATYRVTFTKDDETGEVTRKYEKETGNGFETVEEPVFTNEYNYNDQPVISVDGGDLTVSKTVSGKGANTDEEFSFTVTLDDEGINGKYGDMDFVNGAADFTLKHGERKTASGLPAGTAYTVSETGTEDYRALVNGNEGSEAEGTIEEDATKSVAFENIHEDNAKIDKKAYGGFTVSKTVTGSGADLDDGFSFTVTLSNKSVTGTYGQMVFKNGKAGFKLKHGEEITASDLPEGIRYNVTEGEKEGYEPWVNGNKGNAFDSVIEKDKLGEVRFNNLYKDAIKDEGEKEDTGPETGDTTNTGLWVMLFCLAVICALFAGRFRLR